MESADGYLDKLLARLLAVLHLLDLVWLWFVVHAHHGRLDRHEKVIIVFVDWHLIVDERAQHPLVLGVPWRLSSVEEVNSAEQMGLISMVSVHRRASLELLHRWGRRQPIHGSILLVD